jgi:hypothetical protein
MTDNRATPIELAADEQIRRTWLAARSKERTATGGRLFLTNQRVVFRPGLRNRIFGADEVSFERSAIVDVQVEPQRSGLFNGGFRHRVLVRLNDGIEHHFVVNRPQTFASALRAELHLETPT